MKGDTVNTCRAVRGKTKAPWMPPGKTSVRESACKWEVQLILLFKTNSQVYVRLKRAVV